MLQIRCCIYGSHTVVEHRSLTGELSLSCAGRHSSDEHHSILRTSFCEYLLYYSVKLKKEVTI